MSAGHQTNTRTCACGAHIKLTSDRCKPCQRVRFNNQLREESAAYFCPDSREDALRADRALDDPARALVIGQIAAKFEYRKMPWQE